MLENNDIHGSVDRTMQNNIDLFGLGAIIRVTTGSGCDFMKKQYLEAVGIYHYPLLMPEKGSPCGEQKRKDRFAAIFSWKEVR